jgi:hypothetical protein
MNTAREQLEEFVGFFENDARGFPLHIHDKMEKPQSLLYQGVTAVFL